MYFRSSERDPIALTDAMLEMCADVQADMYRENRIHTPEEKSDLKRTYDLKMEIVSDGFAADPVPTIEKIVELVEKYG